MLSTIPFAPSDSARVFFSRLGYHQERERNGQESYGKRVRGGEFPRFHVYIHQAMAGKLTFRLHLDQKRPSYAGSHAHGGEYDGPLVEAEVQRIVSAARG